MQTIKTYIHVVRKALMDQGYKNQEGNNVTWNCQHCQSAHFLFIFGWCWYIN